MKCGDPGCTGKHSHNSWGEMCPAAKERKRSRQRAWVRDKYWNNAKFRREKLDSNYCYKTTAAGMCAQIRSNRRQQLLRANQ